MPFQKCSFRVGVHGRKPREGFKAQESRTLTNFQKKNYTGENGRRTAKAQPEPAFGWVQARLVLGHSLNLEDDWGSLSPWVSTAKLSLFTLKSQDGRAWGHKRGEFENALFNLIRTWKTLKMTGFWIKNFQAFFKSWWAFRPRKKIFRPPPPQIPCRHPPPPILEEPSPRGIFN